MTDEEKQLANLGELLENKVSLDKQVPNKPEDVFLDLETLTNLLNTLNISMPLGIEGLTERKT